MKASQIIALSTSVFFAGLSAHGYTTTWGNALHHIQAGAHNQSPTAESHKKYPSRKEAIEQLMKFEGDNASDDMYKPIICTVQEDDGQWQYKHTLLNTDFQNVMYAGSKYIITVEGGQNGTDWIVINTFHIWDSKTLKHIKALACVAPRDTKDIMVDEQNHRFAIAMCESHGAASIFAYDINTDELEYIVYSTEDDEEFEKKRAFKKRIFKSFNRFINDFSDYRSDNGQAGEKSHSLNGLKDYFDAEKTNIIHRLDFDTLQLNPRQQAEDSAVYNITISDIENAPSGMNMVDPYSQSSTGNESGFRVLYPERFQDFHDVKNAKNRESLGAMLYDIKKQRLLPISASLFHYTDTRPSSGESDCGKLFYIFTHVTFFHGQIYKWSPPQLFNEEREQWEIITFNGKQPQEFHEDDKVQRPVAYDVKADVPDGLGVHMSVWNQVPGDEEHTYWLAAADGYCGLFLMNETTKTGELIQSWRGAWSVAEENNPAPIWLAEKQWLCIPVEKHGWEVYEVTDFSKPAQKKFDIYVGGRDSWAILLPNGHYAGSPGCEKLFTRYTKDGEENMQALSLWRNRPAEVLETLGGNEDDIEALKATTKRWLARKGLNMDAMPPEPMHADFAKVEIGEQELMPSTDTVTFPAKLTAGAKKALTALKVRVNGAEIRQEWSDSLLITPGSTETVNVTILLESGQNMVELVPVDSTDIEGIAESFRMVKASQAPSQLYVVTLGVSDYDLDELDLQFAAKDAKDLSLAFAHYGNGKVRTLTLTDKDVKDKSVLQKVQDFLSTSAPEDRVVLYLAGHGMLNDELEYHYAPAGFDPQKINETGISMDALVACLQTATARERVLLLDTCHSGTLGEEGEDKLAIAGVQLPPGVRAIQHRGMQLKKATGPLTSNKQRKRYIEDMFSMGAQYQGVNIVAGAAGAEYALESGEWNNGVFTASLIQLLQACDHSDLNNDGYLSVQEMIGALQTKVHQLTGGAQKPNLVASASPYTALCLCISTYVLNKDWDAICARIKHMKNEQEILMLLDVFAVIRISKEHYWSLEEKITEFIKKQESTGRKYSETEKAFLMAEAKNASDLIQIPCQVWECVLQAGIPKETILAYKEYTWGNNADAKAIQRMLDRGGKPEEKSTKGSAAEEAAQLRTLIRELGNTNYYNRTNQLYQKRLLAVLPIIANGGYIDTKVDAVLKNSNGTTALHNACGLGHYELVEWLLRNGANVNTRATNGATPVQCVGDDNDSSGQIRALLSKYGASTTGAATGTSSGEAEKLQTLIRYLRETNYSDRTYQLYQRRLLAVLPVIANGGYVDTNIDTVLANSNGTTALHNACGLGYYALVEWLLRNGANVHARATNGVTPIQCVSNDPHGQISALLRKYGAPATVTATRTNSGELEKLQTLIGYLRAANYTDRTHQLYQRRLLAVLPIIANGGYVNTNIDTVLKNSNGTTALHNACALGYQALVEWLLRNGANVHAQATNGATPEQCIGNDPFGQIRALLQQYK